MSDLSDQSSSKSSDRTASITTARTATNTSLPLKPVVGNPLKRVIDESKLCLEDAEKLEKRRAYNRESATRARKRTKHLVHQLQNEVAQEKQEKLELQRKNEELRARVVLLEKHNQTLLLKQLVSERRQVSMASSAAFLSGTGLTLGGLSNGMPSGNMMFSGLGPSGF